MSEKPEFVPPDRSVVFAVAKPMGLIAIAVAAVWCVSLATDTYRAIKIKPEVRTIKVVGSAKKRITSDLIEWSAVLEARAPDRTAAYKLMREHREKAVAFIASQGVKASEIQPQSTTFEEEFNVETELKMLQGAKEPVKVEKKTFKGYVTREVISVHSADIPAVEKASRAITSLLEQGVSVTSNAPLYFYTKLGELKVEQLAAAGRDVRLRADNILKSAGGASIKRLRKTNMGIININPANSTETSNEGNNDTTSLEKDIITIVHAEFELTDD